MFEEFGKMMEPIDFGEEIKLGEEDIIIESVKTSVFDWIEKYHPREGESNLRVNNPEDTNELIRWKNGVIGRINHQILGSGFGNYSDKELEKIIAVSLHEYFSDDPWYIDYLLNVLPSCKN